MDSEGFTCFPAAHNKLLHRFKPFSLAISVNDPIDKEAQW